VHAELFEHPRLAEFLVCRSGFHQSSTNDTCPLKHCCRYICLHLPSSSSSSSSICYQRTVAAAPAAASDVNGTSVNIHEDDLKTSAAAGESLLIRRVICDATAASFGCRKIIQYSLRLFVPDRRPSQAMTTSHLPLAVFSPADRTNEHCEPVSTESVRVHS
jgi:hypothetical protein